MAIKRLPRRVRPDKRRYLYPCVQRQAVLSPTSLPSLRCSCPSHRKIELFITVYPSWLLIFPLCRLVSPSGTTSPAYTTSSPSTPSSPAVELSVPTASTPVIDRTVFVQDSSSFVHSTRGTRRPRSNSEDEVESDTSRSSESARPPPRRRQRQSTATEPLLLPSFSSDIPTVSPCSPTDPASHITPIRTSAIALTSPRAARILIPASSASNSPTAAHTAVRTSPMGPPALSHGIRGEGEAGPSTSNGHTYSNGNSNGNTVSHIRRVNVPGRLMYEDDKGWERDEVNEFQFDAFGSEYSAESVRPRTLLAGAKRMPINREEMVRLMLQGLKDIGYNQAADVLEAESGYKLATRAVTEFQSAILGGRWSEALALLPELGIDMTPSVPVKVEDPASSGNSIREGSIRSLPLTHGLGGVAEEIRFLVSQQKYLEYLEIGQQKKALNTLRSEVAPIATDQDVLHTLSGFMLCLDRNDLYERAAWDGAAGSSRRRLLEQLQNYISPKVMVPERRLATLLDQARQYQMQGCLYHQEAEAPSLYTDHECRPGQFPSVTTHVLADHRDEVWRIEWSPDGWSLASAGKDCQVIIWEIELMSNFVDGSRWSVRPKWHLTDHKDPVDVLAWSPDGKTLVTGADKTLYLWDTSLGKRIETNTGPSPHHDTISAIQWKSNGSEFLVSSMDCKLVFYTPAGAIIRQWSFNTTQIVDFLITPDDERMVAVTTSLKRVPIDSKLKPSMSTRAPELGQAPDPVLRTPGRRYDHPFAYGSMEHGLMMIRLADKEVIDWSNDLHCEITGIKLSWDAKRVIISCNPDEIQMWSIEPHLRPIRSYKGHVQSRFLIRSGFGGVKDRFILSGSEDGHVYVWQAGSPHPIQVLAGHEGVVNCVAWNSEPDRRLFASCSDDGAIRIWQPPELDFNADPSELDNIVAKEENMASEASNGHTGNGIAENVENDGLAL